MPGKAHTQRLRPGTLKLGAGEGQASAADRTDGPSPALGQKRGLGGLQKAASGPGRAQAHGSWPPHLLLDTAPSQLVICCPICKMGTASAPRFSACSFEGCGGREEVGGWQERDASSC